jgi:hypothetical protein
MTDAPDAELNFIQNLSGVVFAGRVERYKCVLSTSLSFSPERFGGKDVNKHAVSISLLN